MKSQVTAWNIIMSKYLKLSLIVVIVVVAGMFWFSGGKTTADASQQIETTQVDKGDIIRTVASSGSVRPLITVEVGSQISGQIAEIFVDFNSQVEKGQLLAVIDPQTFETRVLQSKADFRVATSNVIVQQANIDRARANLRRARLEYERARPLAEQGTLSAAEMDSALAAFESAKADLTMAEAQLDNALAAKDQREASLKSAQIDLDRTKIRSPIDGVVIERAVDQGQTVAASLSSPILFNIAQDLNKIQIEANVDEADIGNVKKGDPVNFTVDAFPDMAFSGEVNQVRLAPNETNNVVTYTVIITADNPGRKLLPGMTAIVEIITGKSENVLRIANQAIRFKPPAGSGLSEQAGDAEPGQGRQRRGPDMDHLKEAVGFNDSQSSLIQQDMASVFGQMRAQFQAAAAEGGDMSAIREQMSQGIDAVFRKHLTKEQFDRYQDVRRQSAESRAGVLWVQSKDGEISPVRVRFGISDDNHTQLLSKDLKEGDTVVTRIRRSQDG
jgi:HlyD family secretion protein